MSKEIQERFSVFNINDYFYVKLKDGGYQLLADNHNKYVGVIPNLETRSAEYYKIKADKDGYTAFQAWCFIEEFGPVTRIGIPSKYYETDIRLENRSLKPAYNK